MKHGLVCSSSTSASASYLKSIEKERKKFESRRGEIFMKVGLDSGVVSFGIHYFGGHSLHKERGRGEEGGRNIKTDNNKMK